MDEPSARRPPYLVKRRIRITVIGIGSSEGRRVRVRVRARIRASFRVGPGPGQDQAQGQGQGLPHRPRRAPAASSHRSAPGVITTERDVGMCGGCATSVRDAGGTADALALAQALALTLTLALAMARTCQHGSARREHG